MEELTVQIQKPIIPPLVWNKEAVEAYVNEALEKYVGIVYTDDMIDDAKKDRAKLNALEKQLAKAFTATKDVYLGPLTELETVTKDLRQKIKKTSGEIDTQVKSYEDALKQDKKNDLYRVYTTAAGALAVLVPFEKIFNERWLNKTYAFSTAEKELKTIIEEKRLELDDLADDCEPGEEYEAVKRAYLKNLSMKEARAERKAFRDFKAQQEQAAAAKAAEEAAAPRLLSSVPPPKTLKSKRRPPRTSRCQRSSTTTAVWTFPLSALHNLSRSRNPCSSPKYLSAPCTSAIPPSRAGS